MGLKINKIWLGSTRIMAVNKIGVEKLVQFFQIFTRFNSDQIVSVGSGKCGLEVYLEEKFDRKILCIDPDPGSYLNDDKRFPKTRDPDYPLVDDLIRDREELIGNCNVILNWPSPNNQGDSFDILAIKALNPKMIFLLFEESGSSGSPDLINWIWGKVEGCEPKGNVPGLSAFIMKMYDLDLTKCPDEKYRMSSRYTHTMKTKSDRFHYKYLILSREDQDMGDFESIDETSESFNDDDECCIM